MNNKPTVLIIGKFLSQASSVRGACEDLAEQMRKAGWVVVTTSSKPGRMASLLDMLKTIWTRRNEYQVASIDIFSGWGFLWAEATAYLLYKIKKPYLLTLHGGSLPKFALRWPKRVTRMLKSASAVTVPSRYLLEKMKPYRPDLLLVLNPIDVLKYSFNLRAHPRPALIWLRAFHDIYNAPLAIYVANSLVPCHPQFYLTMGGGDKGDGSFQRTKQLAEALGVSDSVEFAGRIPKNEVPAWLQKGDIFINTTNIDNTPISVMEAMACGLCIVSTNVGGIPYLLENEKDALLVPPNDPESMASAIYRILTEPGLAEKLSKNAREKAEQFDWSVILPQWEKLFESLIKTND